MKKMKYWIVWMFTVLLIPFAISRCGGDDDEIGGIISENPNGRNYSDYEKELVSKLIGTVGNYIK